MSDDGTIEIGETGAAALSGRRPVLLNRRSFLGGTAAGLGVLGLAGCSTTDTLLLAEARQNYGPMPDEKFPIPAVDISKVDPKYYRRVVQYESKEAPGTIIVDPGKFYVYRIEGDGAATRYGANVGRDGFLWSGDAYVGRKSEWATWTPPKEMIERHPEKAVWADGMPGGPDNPLGARALYLFENGADTLYRIHGTIEPESIGKAASSGCIRMLNEDIVSLYDKVEVGTPVIVRPAD